MIDDSWLAWAGEQFGRLVFRAFPDPPAQVVSACATVQSALIGSDMAVFSHFVPFSAIVGVAIIFGVAAIAFAIRVTRIVISLASGGGGA